MKVIVVVVKNVIILMIIKNNGITGDNIHYNLKTIIIVIITILVRILITIITRRQSGILKYCWGPNFDWTQGRLTNTRGTVLC